MSVRPSRRQWLLGLIGGIFGTAAAKAADRLLPGGSATKPPAGSLSFTCRAGLDGKRESALLEPFNGKALIEPGATPGTFRLRLEDQPNGSAPTTYEGLTSLYFREAKSDPIMPISCVTHTYDANGDLVSTYRPVGRRTYYTYDGVSYRESPQKIRPPTDPA